MSSEIAIEINAISKSFEIYEKPIDRLKQSIWCGSKQFYKEFKALENVSFKVKKGETIALVGRNGAGKSTLLQIICGTLSPSSGELKVNGKIAALLELGAGFNPEFTGRENVFMSAMILGLKKNEIEERFDIIAAFADIGEFMEQPVKTYSSGMYVRLAFAVIAHVDADILIIDEALSVGDAVFTQKCMRFIRSFQEKGTLLFVSHDMGAVQNLCKSAVWLGDGRVQKIGNADVIAQDYLRHSLQEVYGKDHNLTATLADEAEQSSPTKTYESAVKAECNLNSATGWKTGSAEILQVSFGSRSSDTAGVFEGGEDVRMLIKAIAHEKLINPILGFIVKDRLGQDLFGENTLPFSSIKSTPIKAGQKFEAIFDFRFPMLPNGEYVVMASLADGDLIDNVQHHYLHDAYVIHVSSSKVRWGLVGLAFEQVFLEVKDGKKNAR